jgi:hypothetical protein
MSLLLALTAGGGGAVNYTLACASGSYVYTGQAATLTFARRLSLAAGAYVYTGQSATLTVARRLPLSAGAYNYIGNDAALAYVPGAGKVDYVLACAAGAYSYIGQAATLTYQSGAPQKVGGDDAIWRKSPHKGFDLEEWKRNNLDTKLDRTIKELLRPNAEILEAAEVMAVDDDNERLTLLLLT